MFVHVCMRWGVEFTCIRRDFFCFSLFYSFGYLFLPEVIKGQKYRLNNRPALDKEHRRRQNRIV